MSRAIEWFARNSVAANLLMGMLVLGGLTTLPAITMKTFPDLEVKTSTAQVEHETSTSKIGEDQIFYCQQRGISSEDAVSMIVNGFCKQVFRQLPMEFAVEAQKLLGVGLEGSVG